MAEIRNRFVSIIHQIEGAPHEGDFQVISANVSSKIDPGSNLLLVKCLQLSIDPYQLNRMKSSSSSHSSHNAATKLVPGKTIDGYGIGRVVSSGNPEFEEGDFVAGQLDWAEYVMIDNGRVLRKLDPIGFPLSYHIGILGVTGFTAYVGFFKVCKPKKGERVFVSTAAGSVGYLVGQYAKLSGCYVVGCAGTAHKVALLKEKLGFDDAFNYKEESDLKSTLRRYFPDGMDIYFDNVGGEMLEAAVANMNQFGRLAACGAISQYTDSTRRSAAGPDMIDIIYKRITITGFIAYDFWDDFAEFITVTANHLRKGELQALEEISYGLESIPSAFANLFCGHNTGKTIVQVADD